MSRPADGGGDLPRDPPERDERAALLRRDALRFLRVRERTRREVREHLARRGHPAALIRQALEELREAGFVDDRRFAEVYLRDRRRLRPMSRAAALRELAGRGVARAVAAEALDEADPPWDDLELAEGLLARRWARWPADQRRARAVRLLRGRGFGAAAIRAALAARAGEEGSWA
ncbi:MAG: RecX family transcriptional regulator [Candidatus Eisenbacteria bacterium]|uniref:Regulatory protein RecX n=1 Tax=Eiseniibacteriota bacterium TaxID=2212470 RepID=A0A938BQV6_UNCEI|nr:RecX family transcriptional regulator [Candidatus Eisenbacteria bacterium]